MNRSCTARAPKSGEQLRPHRAQAGRGQEADQRLGGSGPARPPGRRPTPSRAGPPVPGPPGPAARPDGDAVALEASSRAKEIAMSGPSPGQRVLGVVQRGTGEPDRARHRGRAQHGRRRPPERTPRNSARPTRSPPGPRPTRRAARGSRWGRGRHRGAPPPSARTAPSHWPPPPRAGGSTGPRAASVRRWTSGLQGCDDVVGAGAPSGSRGASVCSRASVGGHADVEDVEQLGQRAVVAH